MITAPRKHRGGPPVLPILGAVLLVAVAGIAWRALGSRPETPVAADGAAGPPSAPASPTLAPELAEATPGAEPPRAQPPETESVTATPEVTPTPVPDAVLDVAVPSGAELRVDGRRARAGAQRVSPGRHTIEVIRPEVLGAQREIVEIDPGQRLRRSYGPDDYGWLQVVVIPWAEVFVGGESIGQTPMPRVKAAVGEHTLALRHPEFEEQRRTVVVQKGETTLVRVTLGASR